MIPPDLSVEAQPASEDIANALQILSDTGHAIRPQEGWTYLTWQDVGALRRLLGSALQKLGAVPPAEQDTPQ